MHSATGVTLNDLRLTEAAIPPLKIAENKAA